MPGSTSLESTTTDNVNMDQRRISNASDTSLQDGAAKSTLSTQESVEFIPTRGSKVTPPKPAANPLQFIKVGPCDLYKTAQEQIKKVEEVKKIKAEVRDEAEDWQSNLDNWKCGRRKRQEHIIERVVEVKKLELEEHDRNRRRSKTFNEMMEERNTRGRKASLMVYNDDEANSLSDLGIGTSSGDDNQSLSDRDDQSHNGNHGDDEMTTNDNSSLDTPYDRAIQNYVNFAETRIKTKNNINEENTPAETNGHKDSNGKTPPQYRPRRESAPKIEEKIAFLDERRRSSTELNNADKIKLVKVDVSKRKELFEKADNDDAKLPSKVTNFNQSKSIKERLSHLEKHGEMNEGKSVNRASCEISGSIKDRLSSLERQKSPEKQEAKEVILRKRLSNGDVSAPQTVKERLSFIERERAAEEAKTVSHKIPVDVSIKERVTNLDSSINKDVQRVTPDRDPSFHSKLANFQNEEAETIYNTNVEKTVAGSERSSSPEDEIYATKRTQFHRSLDSLDVEDDLANGGFERVQSLEDIECLGRRHYPPSASSTEMLVFSSQSGDTDREDSGIHTADVSSSVSQADEPVEDVELIGHHLDVDVEIVGHRRQLSELSEQMSPLPPIQEMFESSTMFVNVDEGQEKSSQSDDEPLEAVIASRTTLPEHTMLATREVTAQDMTAMPQKEEEKIQARDVVNREEVVEETLVDFGNMHSEETIYHTKTDYGNGYSIQEQIVQTQVLTNEVLPLNLDSDLEMLSNELVFSLSPTSAEPPKEKPPPPPTELSDEETSKPKASLRRIDSTKRIKKEIRRKRSDFLGIEGNTDDSYLEPVLSVAPDMTAFLIEEQRQQKQLYRQSICSESDSNPGESRDSGVELERHVDDHWLGKQVLTPDMSTQHSRQESELYGNTSSVTSEEDEITKKEREIIEILEKEEQWRYANNNSTQDDLGEKLAEKLRQLEQEKLQLEWDRAEEERRRVAEEKARHEETMRLRAKEQDLRKQESNLVQPIPAQRCGDGNNVGEVIRMERERLQLEQEELVNQRENLIQRETQQLHRNMKQWDMQPSSAVSLQDISHGSNLYQYNGLPPVVPPAPLNYRLSLPDLQEQVITNPRPAVHRAPPPVPPAKPNRSQMQRERDNRSLSAVDAVQLRHGNLQPERHNGNIQPERHNVNIQPDRLNGNIQPERHNGNIQPERHNGNIQPDVQLRHNGSSQAERHTQPDNVQSRHSTGNTQQQMSRQTLQALSAAPRSRIVSTDNWIQAKKKPESQRNSGQNNSYNYQHWLIQEAEHRRITEQQQRNAPVSPRRTQPPRDKPLPDAIIHTLTQRVQNRAANNETKNSPTRRDAVPNNHSPNKGQINGHNGPTHSQMISNGPIHGHTNNSPQVNGHGTVGNSPMNGQTVGKGPVNGNASVQMNVQTSTLDSQEKMLSVSGKKKCSHCTDELGRGAAMIIESLRLFYHIDCFKCCVCHVQLGDGLMGTDVRVRNNKLHCHNCYSSDDGVKFSCV